VTVQLGADPLPQRQRILLGCVGLLGTAALGELLLRTGVVSAVGLALPSVVMAEAARLLGDSAFLDAVSFTLREWALGVGLAAVVGTVLGGLMGASRTVAVMFELPVEILRPLPSIAIGPVLVLLFGSGMLPNSLTVAVATVWPILFNAMYGVQSVDKTAVQTAKTLRMSRWTIATKVRLPAALPFVFTGLRVSASIGLIVAVSVELLIGAGNGIGGFILVNSTSGANLDVVYAATLIGGILGVVISLVLAGVERLAFPWKAGLAQ
jgi:NitT/TauT family transport system permease protein